MDLKTLLLHSLSNDGLIKKRHCVCFNNRCYTVSYQLHGKFLTIRNIRKIVKNKEIRRHNILRKKQFTVQQTSPVRQCIFVDMAVQTQDAVVECKSTSVETEKYLTEEKAQQAVSDHLRLQSTQTEIKLSSEITEEKAQQTASDYLRLQSTQTEIKLNSESTQTFKNTIFRVTQTETKFLMTNKSAQTNVKYTTDNKTQTDKEYLRPDKTSQTSTLVTTDHTIQTVAGYGMPDKRSQTPPLYTADNMAQTISGYGMPDKRSQTTTKYTAHNKTQTDKQYQAPSKRSQTLTLVTTDNTVQTISGYGMPDKKLQTIPLVSTHKFHTVSANRLPKKRSQIAQLITVPETDFGHQMPVKGLNNIPTFVADRTTQTDKVNEISQKRAEKMYCHNCSHAMNAELNDNIEQTQVEKDAVVLMLNEIGEMIINQNYLLHNNSTLLGQISEMTLLQKMVSRQNSAMRLRTKLENQRKIRNYIRERSKKIRYIYYETTKLTKTSNVLLQTVEYQLNASTQTRKEDFLNQKRTKVRKFLLPLAYKFATQETRNHRKF